MTCIPLCEPCEEDRTCDVVLRLVSCEGRDCVARGAGRNHADKISRDL